MTDRLATIQPAEHDPFLPQMLVAPFISQWMDMVPLNHILRDPVVASMFPHGPGMPKPIFVHKYDMPLHMMYSNYKNVAHLSEAAADQILAAPCSCADPAMSPYIGFDGCVCTMDPGVCQNPDAQAFFRMGRKYRPVHHKTMQMSAALRTNIISGLHSAVHSYVERMELALEHPGALMLWSDEVRGRISHLVSNLPSLQHTGSFARELFKANDYVGHTLPGSFHRFRQTVQRMQQSYVLT